MYCFVWGQCFFLHSWFWQVSMWSKISYKNFHLTLRRAFRKVNHKYMIFTEKNSIFLMRTTISSLVSLNRKPTLNSSQWLWLQHCLALQYLAWIRTVTLLRIFKTLSFQGFRFNTSQSYSEKHVNELKDFLYKLFNIKKISIIISNIWKQNPTFHFSRIWFAYEWRIWFWGDKSRSSEDYLGLITSFTYSD